MLTDEIEVDPDRLEAFALRLLEELAQTNHPVNFERRFERPLWEELAQTNHPVKAAQIRAVLGPPSSWPWLRPSRRADWAREAAAAVDALFVSRVITRITRNCS